MTCSVQAAVRHAHIKAQNSHPVAALDFSALRLGWWGKELRRRDEIEKVVQMLQWGMVGGKECVCLPDHNGR